jgi:EVE domain
MRYWINTVSRAHVLAGVTGGFTQADHGRPMRLKRLGKGDLIVFYSPRTEFQGGEPLQTFTAIGRIADDEPFQVEMSSSFHPWRRRVEFLDCVEAPIQPLLMRLAFIKDKSRWGFPFRRGLFDIDRADFTWVAQAMKATWASDEP